VSETPAETPAVQPLRKSQKWLAVGAGTAGTALAALGGFESYGAVRQVAVAHGFAHPSVFPLGVDTAVVALFLAELLLAWLDMPFPPLRWGAWALVGATIWWNAAASAGNVLGMAMHAAAPLLVVVVVWIEAIRHAVRTRTQMATGQGTDRRLRRWRWLLAPVATFRMWRARCLWNVTSYAEAIALDRRRLLVKARLRKKWGWTRHGFFWWALAPAEERMALRLGLEDALAAAAPAGDPQGASSSPQAGGTATAPPAAPRRQGRKAAAKRGERTDEAVQLIAALRAGGGARPEGLHLRIRDEYGLERTYAQRLVNRHWPIDPIHAVTSTRKEDPAA